MDHPQAVALTRNLLHFDTINPPGRERDCAHHVAALLEAAGYKVDFHEYEPGRTSVIARIGGNGDRPPLCLTGHIDTVPLGAAAWTRDPFAGETDGDKLYGRGSSDMKAGVAAIVAAAIALAPRLGRTAGVVLVLTAAEEGGCVGSRHLIELPRLMGRAGAIVVGEPTSNYPFVGHKGSVKFNATFRGVSAHGSMPHLGVNAIFKAARALGRLECFDFKCPVHRTMGAPTLNVGTIEGGNAINSVPDLAWIGIDVRTVPGQDHDEIVRRIQSEMGEAAEVEVVQDMPSVWTEPDAEWIQRVFEIAARHLRERPEPRTLSYNTDAGNLLKLWSGAPTVILGPGEAAMAHQTDEYCHIGRIGQAVALYEDLIRDWCGC